MANGQKVIAIIDDDATIRNATAALVDALGYCTEVYSSGEEFIDAAMKSEAGCLVVDIQLGDITGVELVRHLSAMGLTFPVIFMTGSQDALTHLTQYLYDAVNRQTVAVDPLGNRTTTLFDAADNADVNIESVNVNKPAASPQAQASVKPSPSPSASVSF